MIKVYFGVPGVGKTTLAVKNAILALRSKSVKYSFVNFPCDHPKLHSCVLRDLGRWTFPKHSYFAIDEAGIEYNNRSYKSLPSYTISWFKLYRHYQIENIDVFSQSWDDMDITLRRLANELWFMRKIGPFTLCQRIYKFMTIDEQTHQIIDGYRKASPLWLLVLPLQWIGLVQPKFTLTYRPFYYKYFNTYDAPPLPVLDFASGPDQAAHGSAI